MGTTVVDPTPVGTEDQPFDVAKYLAEKNEQDVARRLKTPPTPKPADPGKGPETPPPAAEPEPDATKTEAKAEPVKPAEPRSNLSRRERKYYREAIEAKTLATMLERRIAELEAKSAPRGGDPAPEVTADPEPQREAYATEGEYSRALGRWDARQEAKNELAKAKAETTKSTQQQAYVARVAAMDQKFTTDRDGFEDWDAKVAVARKLEFTPTDTLTALFETSDSRAAVLYHLASHPKDVERLESLKDDPAEQIQLFRRIEGKSEVLYNPEQRKAKVEATPPPPPPVEKKPEPPPKPTAAELDAKLPKPSESVVVRSGTVPKSDIPVTLENGMINPAWKEWRNQQSRARP